MKWRVGRKVGRTIYLMGGDEPSDNDTLIGVMDDPDLAAEVVRCVNGERHADIWDEGYARGVRDEAGDIERADNPYRLEIPER